MATIDLTRHATDFRKHYSGVRMQQGRVLTDDDFNENGRLGAEDLRKTRVDVIGPAGSPDEGFLIADPVIDATSGRPTFTIKAGTFYLGGQRLALEADEYYHLQKDWLQQGAVAGDWLTVPTGSRFDLAYLETWQRAVSAVEDSELLEIALGGPDTSVRSRTYRRVRTLANVGSGDCGTAWETLLNGLAAEGTLNDENELVPDANLKVEPDGTAGSSDLCSPPVTGGYLGADNQAIRVQISGPNEFTWGYDNASPLYRIQLGVDGNAQRRRITLLTEPKDQAHWPLIGQVVELLPWSAVLPNGQKTAEAHGHLAKVTASYNPDTQQFDVDSAPPDDASGQPFGETWKLRTGPDGDAAALGNEGEFFYLQVWNRGSDTASSAHIPFTAGAAVTLAHTGLKVTFSGTQLRQDDFWIIAARPDSPNTFVPWDLATNRRPQGVRRWITPLAVISWPGGTVDGTVESDCRDTFLPLTRRQTCCTVTVGDGIHSHGQFTSIQKAIDSLPADGGCVCILCGTYKESVRIVDLHNVILSGCGPRTILQGLPPKDKNASADPVIWVLGGRNISLESFAVQADETGEGILFEGKNIFTTKQAQQRGAPSVIESVWLYDLIVTAGQRSALRARFVKGMTVQRSEFRNHDEVGTEHTVTLLVEDARFERNAVEVFAEPQIIETVKAAKFETSAGTNAYGGIQLQGTCRSVSLIDNTIRGGAGHGITLGSTRTTSGPGDIGPGNGNNGGVIIDPCSMRDDFDIVVYFPFEGNQKATVISEGALSNIRIERNRISSMGGCGIGVDRFFDLRGADEFISVSNLTIIGNDITRCLQRTIAEPTEAVANFVGYGGIALADVENLVVHDNFIAENGATVGDPVCGFFGLHLDGADLSRNRILDNGAVSTAANTTLKRGNRGGVVIVYALAPTLEITVPSASGQITTEPAQNGVPALKLHDNIITTPLGEALQLNALGPVSIVANQFTTRGVARSQGSPGFAASTIRIFNLGFSNEFYLEYLLFNAVAKNGQIDAPQPGLDDEQLGHALANGQVLFANNQVNSDFFAVGSTLTLAPILIVTLDDLAFHGNQCEANLSDDFIISHALLLALSLRITDNRFTEGIYNAIISLLSIGLFANTTALNQATHCLLALGARLQNQLNTTIVGPNPLLSGNFKTCDAYDKALLTALGA